MPNPLDKLPFPVRCNYPDCGAGPFTNGVAVDEHIMAEHLTEAIWDFAESTMEEVEGPRCQTQIAGR
jgi:hypothetical protein